MNNNKHLSLCYYAFANSPPSVAALNRLNALAVEPNNPIRVNASPERTPAFVAAIPRPS